MNQLLLRLFFSFMAWTAMHAHATSVLVLNEHLAKQDLAPYLVALEDADANLSIEAARQLFNEGKFTPVDPKKGFNKGYTRSVWWIALQVQSTAQRPPSQMQWLMELSFPTLDRVDVYLPQSATPVSTGDTLPFSSRPLRHLNYVFPITPTGTDIETVMLRVQSQGTLMAPLTAWSTDAFAASSRLTYAGQAAYFGALLAMVIYNALLWVSIRERVYVDYVLYATFIGLAIGAANSMAAEFLWPDIGWLVNYSYWAFGFAGIFVTRFARSFLNTAATSVWLDRTLQATAWLVGIPILIGFFVSYYAGGRLVSGALLIALVVAAWSGIYSVYRNRPGARLYLLSWFLFLAFAAMYPLRNYGLIPTNFFTVHGIQIGSLAEMMLLSFALAARINHIRAEKDKAQHDAIAAQHALVATLKESEKILELRVTERTAELEQANRKLSALSMTDGLTGIANRRRFDEALAEEWKRMHRLGQPLTLGMIDIDWFKKYNDHYGHQAGDACLIAVATTLAENVARTGDLVARYGGEEFVFIAPAVDSASGLAMGQKICAAIAAKCIGHEPSPYKCVTASIGLATLFPTADTDPVYLTKLADQALYRAKESGRNRAVSMEQPTSL